MLKKYHTRQGNIIGGCLLLSGSCIGVGMLALPVLTGFAGFWPTLVAFILCWGFMNLTALLLLELNLSFPESPNIVSLSEKTLGKGGKWGAWLTFIFLFCSLIVAYLSKGGDLLVEFFDRVFFWNLSQSMGATILAIFSGLVIFCGTHLVDRFNRLCMLSLFATYMYLLGIGQKDTSFTFLKHTDWSYTLFSIPFIVTAFGFHNMIPTISTYLKQRRLDLVYVIIWGGLIPFLIYLFWIFKIFSLIPLQGNLSLTSSYQNNEISTQPLALLFPNAKIAITAQFFAFFAIITSLLGQALSVVDFLIDALRLQKTRLVKAFLLALIFIPCLVASQTIANVFFLALEMAGGIAAVILFGIYPAWMVWVGRYRLHFPAPVIVPGGRVTLIAILFFSGSLLIYQVLKNLGYMGFCIP